MAKVTTRSASARVLPDGYGGEEFEDIEHKSLISLSPEQLSFFSDLYHVLVTGVTLYGVQLLFCITYSEMIFTSSSLKPLMAFGIKSQVGSVAVGAIIFAKFSKTGASVPSTDISSAVFIRVLLQQMETELVNSGFVEYEDTMRIAAILCTFAVGISFVLIGAFSLTKILQFVPASLVSGFRACIGYKTVIAGFQLVSHSHLEKTLIPITLSSGIGVVLVLLKFRGYKAPEFLLAMMVLPSVVYHIYLFASDITVEESAGDEWITLTNETEINLTTFYDPLRALPDVAWTAIGSNVATYLVLILIVSVEFLLELAALQQMTTEEIDFNHEMELAGFSTLIAIALWGFPVFTHYKVSSMGIKLSESHKRAACMLFGVISAISVLAQVKFTGLVPDFVLSGFLFGTGFYAMISNLWTIRKRVSREEYLSIVVMFIVNATWSMLAAVATGITMASVSFALAYRKIGVVKHVLSGNNVPSRIVRSDEEERLLEHLSRSFCVVQLHHFIFFGSAAQFLVTVKQIILGYVGHRPKLRYVVIDWSEVDGIDYAGLGTIVESTVRLTEAGIKVVYTGLDQTNTMMMAKEAVFLKVEAVFKTLGEGVEWVEETLLRRFHDVRQRWLEEPCLRHYHQTAINRAKHDVFESIIGAFGDSVWPYIDRINLEYGDILDESSSEDGGGTRSLFIVHTGRLQAFTINADGTRHVSKIYARGAYLNEPGMYLHAPVNESYVSVSNNTVVLRLSPSSMAQMERKSPLLAMELQRTVLSRFFTLNAKYERNEDEVKAWEHGATGRRMTLTQASVMPLPEDVTKPKRSDPHIGVWLVGDALERYLGLRKGRSSEIDDAMQHRLGFHHHKHDELQVFFWEPDGDTKPGVVSRDNFEKLNHDEKVVAFRVVKRWRKLKDPHRFQLRIPPYMEEEARTCFRFHLSKYNSWMQNPGSMSGYGQFSGDQVKLVKEKRSFNSETFSEPNEEEEKGYEDSLPVSLVLDTLNDLGVYMSHSAFSKALEELFGFQLLKQGVPVNLFGPSKNEKELRAKVSFLSSLPLFSGIASSNPKMFLALAKLAKTLHFYEEDHLQIEGLDSTNLIVVLAGTVSVSKNRSHPVLYEVTDQPLMYGVECFMSNERGKAKTTIVCTSYQLSVISFNMDDVNDIVSANEKALQTLRIGASLTMQLQDPEVDKTTITSKMKDSFGQRFMAWQNEDIGHIIVQKDASILTQLAQRSHICGYSKGEMITNQGKRCDRVIVVLEGQVSAFYNDNPLDNVLLAPIRLMRRGSSKVRLGLEMFCNVANFEFSTIVASLEVTTLELTRQDMDSMFDVSHEVWEQLQLQLENAKETMDTMDLKRAADSSMKTFATGAALKKIQKAMSRQTPGESQHENSPENTVKHAISTTLGSQQYSESTIQPSLADRLSPNESGWSVSNNQVTGSSPGIQTKFSSPQFSSTAVKDMVLASRRRGSSEASGDEEIAHRSKSTDAISPTLRNAVPKPKLQTLFSSFSLVQQDQENREGRGSMKTLDSQRSSASLALNKWRAQHSDSCSTADSEDGDDDNYGESRNQHKYSLDINQFLKLFQYSRMVLLDSKSIDGIIKAFNSEAGKRKRVSVEGLMRITQFGLVVRQHDTELSTTLKAWAARFLLGYQAEFYIEDVLGLYSLYKKLSEEKQKITQFYNSMLNTAVDESQRNVQQGLSSRNLVDYWATKYPNDKSPLTLEEANDFVDMCDTRGTGCISLAAWFGSLSVVHESELQIGFNDFGTHLDKKESKMDTMSNSGIGSVTEANSMLSQSTSKRVRGRKRATMSYKSKQYLFRR